MVKAAGGDIIYFAILHYEKYQFLQSLRKVLKEGKYDIILRITII